MRVVKFFKSSSGKCPVEEFLDSLSAKQAQRVTWVMRLVEELEKVPDIYLKKLKSTEDIWEVRIQASSDIFRVLGFFETGTFIATNGFYKKTQKTPLNEIALAEKRKKEHANK